MSEVESANAKQQHQKRKSLCMLRVITTYDARLLTGFAVQQVRGQQKRRARINSRGDSQVSWRCELSLYDRCR